MEPDFNVPNILDWHTATAEYLSVHTAYAESQGVSITLLGDSFVLSCGLAGFTYQRRVSFLEAFNANFPLLKLEIDKLRQSMENAVAQSV